jgi:NAD(P)-dependent dehydrogenase (short-subunit alcohol dehydrogenase family)
MKRAFALGAAALAAEKIVKRTTALDLQGKRAVVTGGSRGLGFALAQELRAQGARVAICARGEEQLMRARAKLGDDVVAIPCDVSDRAQVDAFIGEVGPVDALVNNAGVIAVGPWQTQTIDDFRESMDIQFWGVVHTTLAVLPSMIDRGGGRIANVTSIGGKVSVPWLLPYNSAKFAAVGFSEGLRAELAGTGVKVTTVVPGADAHRLLPRRVLQGRPCGGRVQPVRATLGDAGDDHLCGARGAAYRRRAAVRRSRDHTRLAREACGARGRRRTARRSTRSSARSGRSTRW